MRREKKVADFGFEKKPKSLAWFGFFSYFFGRSPPHALFLFVCCFHDGDGDAALAPSSSLSPLAPPSPPASAFVVVGDGTVAAAVAAAGATAVAVMIFMRAMKLSMERCELTDDCDSSTSERESKRLILESWISICARSSHGQAKTTMNTMSAHTILERLNIASLMRLTSFCVSWR